MASHSVSNPRSAHKNLPNGSTLDKERDILERTNGNRPRVIKHIGETEVASLIDTGSTVNIMSMDTYNTLNNKPKLQRDNSSNVYAYCSSKPLNINGSFQAKIKYKLHDTEAKFLVTDKPADTLLDYDTASKLGLVYIANQISPGTSRCDRIVAEYEDRFRGIGKLKDIQCKLHEDKTVQPVVQPHQRVPFHVRKKTEQE
ncbi:uncharacterized protein [Ptychodera flava]|uniref:uncharacterized protein n=1 Tax=Ptychodera flava TaxID=63121 RepID=UPI003969ED61